MMILSKDMARVFQASTRRGSDSAEVVEDLNNLRDVAAQVLALASGRAPMFEVSNPVVIIMDRPTDAEIVDSKGTRTANRQNRFRKAAGIAELVEITRKNPVGDYKLSRSEPQPDVVKARVKMSAEQIAELLPPENQAPWGWIVLNFSESGLETLGEWGKTQEKVVALAETKITEYNERMEAEIAAEIADEENDEVTEPTVEPTTTIEDTAPTGKRKAS